MKTIFYLKHANSSFVLTDQKILEKQYRVLWALLPAARKGLRILPFLYQAFRHTARNLSSADALVTWFGDYHSAVLSFMGKLARKPVIIFAGGQEAVRYPEIRKGVYLSRIRGAFTRYALRNATHIIVNHESLILHDNRYYDPAGKPDGIRHHVPGIRTPISVVPNGIDPARFRRVPGIEKEPGQVLTMGRMGSRFDFINKGFDLFVELARRNPSLRCSIIGLDQRFLPWIEEHYAISAVPNLECLLTWCPEELLLQYYSRARVFVQASITEGMPHTLVEAMLCECVPVGSRVNGIPDAIGDTGVIVDRRDAAELDRSVKKALVMETGPAARARALEMFSLAQREERLLRIFREIV